jgi:hypothetical protein
MFNQETVWREVSNDDIWRIRDGECIQDYREMMLMIKTRDDRVCYDLDVDLDKLHHLSESRKRVESTQGEPSGVRYQEGPLEGEKSDGDEEEDPEEEEVMEEEEPYEEVEPMEEGELNIKEESDVVMEPLGNEYLSDPPQTEPKVQTGGDFEM